jgi:hypothetical protein
MSDAMLKLLNGYIELLKSGLDTRPKEIKQVDIELVEKWIKEENECQN